MKLGVETVASKLPWVRLANTPMEVRLSLFISPALVAVVTLLEKPMGTFTVSVPVSFSQDVSVHAERIIKKSIFLNLLIVLFMCQFQFVGWCARRRTFNLIRAYAIFNLHQNYR